MYYSSRIRKGVIKTITTTTTKETRQTIHRVEKKLDRDNEMITIIIIIDFYIIIIIIIIIITIARTDVYRNTSRG